MVDKLTSAPVCGFTTPSQLLIFDFETRSRCPLREQGLAKYAADPSTQVLCAAYILPGTNTPLLWLPGMPVPDFSKYVVAAWNAAFEKSIWEKVLKWPAPKGWYDIAGQSRYAGLPGGLANACKWLGLAEQFAKSQEGHDVMMKLSQPNKPKVYKNPPKNAKPFKEWEDDPALFQKLYDYVKQDCIAEKAVMELLPPWPEQEQKIWAMTLAHNERGVPIDVPLCESVKNLSEQFLDRAQDTVYECTDGKISSPTQNVALKKWLNEQGLNIDGIGADIIGPLLEKGGLPDKVEKVLRARQIGAPASLKKFSSALTKHVGGRLYHSFMYAGAGATARWSGASDDAATVQLQNLTRGKQTELMLDAIKLRSTDVLEAICDDPIKEMRCSTRAMLCAGEGDTFIYTDLSAIEARVLRWLARSPALDDFRKYDLGGPDPYRMEAAKTFAKKVADVTDDERQCGKVLVLSAQYGVGAAKFQGTVFTWSGGKVVISLEFAQSTITKFRKANPHITKFWYALERAFRDVLTGAKDSVTVGYLKFRLAGKNTVAIRLPSGRDMFYNRCRISDKEIQYTKHDGEIVHAYGAHFAENTTQAVARDIMAEGMLGCEAAGLLIVHHAHDQILVETKERGSDEKAKQVGLIMATPPSWCKDLPLASPIKITKRML